MTLEFKFASVDQYDNQPTSWLTLHLSPNSEAERSFKDALCQTGSWNDGWNQQSVREIKISDDISETIGHYRLYSILRIPEVEQ